MKNNLKEEHEKGLGIIHNLNKKNHETLENIIKKKSFSG